MAAHSWEAHTWDNWSYDSDDDGLDDVQRSAAEFMEVLLTQYFMGALSAQVFCILCHWGHKGGLVGDAAKKYAMPPDKSSGKYKDHLDDALHCKEQQRRMYHFEAPGRTRHADQRCKIRFASRSIIATPTPKLLPSPCVAHKQCI